MPRITSRILAWLLLLGTAVDVSAQVITAVPAGGPWHLPSTWMPAITPNLSDGVIIPVGVIVDATGGSAGAPTIAVLGSLIKSTAGSLTIVTGELTVGVGGIIAAGPPTPLSGGSVRIRADPFSFPTVGVTNEGTITATTGPGWGGNVKIDFVGGFFSNLVDGTITATSGGTLSGGDVRVRATNCDNAGEIRAGEGAGFVAGDVDIACADTFVNTATGCLFGGGAGGLFPTLCPGKPVPPVPAFRAPFGPGPVVQTAGGDVRTLVVGTGSNLALAGLIVAGDAATFAGGIRTQASVKIITGVLTAGAPNGNIWLDPDDGEISGAAKLTADVINIVSDGTFRIGNLTAAPALVAASDVNVTILSGGTADLRNNAAGPPDAIEAGTSITFATDTLLLDGGVTAPQIMNQTPTIVAGAQITEIMLLPRGWAGVPDAKTVILPVIISNLGNASETIDYQISDTAGWMTPISTTVTLAANEYEVIEVSIASLPGTLLNDVSVLTTAAQTQGTGFSTSEVVELVSEGPGPAAVPLFAPAWAWAGVMVAALIGLSRRTGRRRSSN